MPRLAPATTAAELEAARALQASQGFRECPAYDSNPLPGVVSAELEP